MEGYRNCKSCGRRYLTVDNSDYCSPSCFSLESTADERKPSKLIFYIPLVCFILFCFFLLEDLDINYFFLRNIPFLRGYAERSFDEAGHNGVFYLHENLKDADDETLLLILSTMAKCEYLGEYKWRTKLVKEVNKLYNEDFPDLQEVAIDLFAAAKMVPKNRLFTKELYDRQFKERVLRLMEAVPSPHFVRTISIVARDPDVDDETLIRCVNVLKTMEDTNLQNAVLCMWLIYKHHSHLVRRAAVMAVPSILWPENAMTFTKQASRNFLKVFKGLQRVASSHKDEVLRPIAQQALDKGRKQKKTFVKFAALDAFEEVFEKE